MRFCRERLRVGCAALCLSAALGGVPGHAQVWITPTDLYEADSTLVQRLRTLRSLPPVPDSVSRRDSLNLSELFAGYKLTYDDTSSTAVHVRAELAPYLEVFTTRLDYCFRWDSAGNLQSEFVPPFSVNEAGITFDDSTTIRSRLGGEPPAQLSELLAQRFHLFRSLGLPAWLAPQDDRNIMPSVLYVHGRNLDSIRYDDPAQMVTALRVLARGMFVYSGPTFVDYDERAFEMRFYIALKNPEVERHHFLTVDERFDIESNQPVQTYCVLHLYPYVRTDNLWVLWNSPTK